jgi:DNA topoisomerase-2
LREIRDGDFRLFEEKNGKKESRNSSDIVEELEEKGYDKDSEDTDNGYGYLLRLQISSITAEKINKLRDDLVSRKSSYEILLHTPEKDIWLRDLAEFEDAYNKWLPVINNESVKKKK